MIADGYTIGGNAFAVHQREAASQVTEDGAWEPTVIMKELVLVEPANVVH